MGSLDIGWFERASEVYGLGFRKVPIVSIVVPFWGYLIGS